MEVYMKMHQLSGWKTRLQAAAFAAMCGIAILVAPQGVLAQEPDVPVAAAIEEVAVATDTVIKDAVEATTFDSGNVAWMLTSTLLVLLMVVPGLALFYGGMVRSKNVLSVIMQVLVVFSLVVLIWIAYGYSASFTEGNDFFGSFTAKAFLTGIGVSSEAAGIPEYLFVAFQSTFAGITTALIVGAFAERMKFSAVLIFSVTWVTLAYFPMVHMVWSGGFLAHKGV